MNIWYIEESSESKKEETIDVDAIVEALHLYIVVLDI